MIFGPISWILKKVRQERPPSSHCRGPIIPYEIIGVFLSHLKYTSKDPFLIQIGANDGKRDDQFHPYISQFSLRGILVEPCFRPFKRLEKLYRENGRVRCENAAIVEPSSEGKCTLYTFADEFVPPHQLSVFSSFDRNHLLKWKKILNLKSEINATEVDAISLANLLCKHQINSCDILVVDTEGYDDKIVYSAMQLRIMPKIIVFENANLSHLAFVELTQILEAKSYINLNLGGDTLSVHASCLHF